MWETIHTNDEILKFMESVCHFHDSCIKEISYISGAYVSENLSMDPLNVRRVLRVVIQRQYEKDSMIEMEFQGLKHLTFKYRDGDFASIDLPAYSKVTFK